MEWKQWKYFEWIYVGFLNFNESRTHIIEYTQLW